MADIRRFGMDPENLVPRILVGTFWTLYAMDTGRLHSPWGKRPSF
jgi:hypothetical protein